MKIELRNISKHFGSTIALDQINLTLEENCIYGLLGNNGAGKSTLLNIITNRIYPTEGQVLADGESIFENDQALGQIFLMGEKNYYPEDMRVNKAFRAAEIFYPHFDMERALELSRQFGLNTKKKISNLSTGYASIFRLVLALSVNTPILLLDEPVLGLDAQHRDLFYRLLLEKYAESPCTILLSTHIIQEVANLLEHVLILHNGRLLKDMPVEELLRGAYTVSGPAALVDQYLLGKEALSVQSVGGLKSATLQQGSGLPKPVEGLQFAPATLQDYFISLMREEEESC